MSSLCLQYIFHLYPWPSFCYVFSMYWMVGGRKSPSVFKLASIRTKPWSLTWWRPPLTPRCARPRWQPPHRTGNQTAPEIQTGKSSDYKQFLPKLRDQCLRGVGRRFSAWAGRSPYCCHVCNVTVTCAHLNIIIKYLKTGASSLSFSWQIILTSLLAWKESWKTGNLGIWAIPSWLDQKCLFGDNLQTNSCITVVLDHCWCLVDSHRRCWSVGRLRKEARKQNRGAREGKAGGEENPWCCWKWWRLCWWWTTRVFF